MWASNTHNIYGSIKISIAVLLLLSYSYFMVASRKSSSISDRILMSACVSCRDHRLLLPLAASLEVAYSSLLLILSCSFVVGTGSPSWFLSSIHTAAEATPGKAATLTWAVEISMWGTDLTSTSCTAIGTKYWTVAYPNHKLLLNCWWITKKERKKNTPMNCYWFPGFQRCSESKLIKEGTCWLEHNQLEVSNH